MIVEKGIAEIVSSMVHLNMSHKICLLGFGPGTEDGLEA